MAYAIEVYEVIYWAELGYCDQDGNQWMKTKSSIPFENHGDALKFLHEHPDVKQMPWGEYRPKWDYGSLRVRREMRLISKS